MWIDGRTVVRRAVAKKDLADSQQALAMQLLCAGRWISRRIGDTEIDGFKSRSIRIAEPGHLNRRGLSGENFEAIAFRMSGQIDQNIDAVISYHSLDCVIARSGDVAPAIGQSMDACRGFVGQAMSVVAENFEVLAIMMTNDRLDKISNRVPREIGRHIADTNTASRIRRQREPGVPWRSCLAHHFPESPVPLENPLPINGS